MFAKISKKIKQYFIIADTDLKIIYSQIEKYHICLKYSKTVSSRHIDAFDAIDSKTLQILTSKTLCRLKPYDHYLPLFKDFSNIRKRDYRFS